jgi:transcription-repair coupling factor (superfamily II helicase)
MQFLHTAFGRLTEFAEIRSAVCRQALPAAATGLSHIHKALLISTLCADTGRRALVVTSDEGEALRLQEDLTAMGHRVAVYPSRDFTFREMSGISHEFEHTRIGVLTRIIEGDYDVAVCGADALLQLTLPPDELLSRTFSLSSGMNIPPAQVCERLVAAGYVRAETVEGAGQFALRGGILDVFPPGNEMPARIEFWGDDIDSIAYFDTVSQRRVSTVDELAVPPAAEVLFDSPDVFAAKVRELAGRLTRRNQTAKDALLAAAEAAEGGRMPHCLDKFLPLAYTPASLFDYTADCLYFVSELGKIKERCRTFGWQLSEDIKAMFEDGTLCKGLDRFALEWSEVTGRLAESDTVFLDTFARGSYDMPVRSAVNFSLRQNSAWNGSVKLLIDDISPALSRGCAVAVLAGTAKAAANLASELVSNGINAVYMQSPADIPGGTAAVVEGGLSSGFECPSIGFIAVARGQNSARPRGIRRAKNKAGSINSLDELHVGDYVVHAAHGIGVFEGIHKLTVDKITKDYIKIRYAKMDVLYVPVTQLDLVSKYIGAAEDGNLKLNRLGGTEWQKTRSRVRSAVRDMAKQLIALYSERMKREGFAFSPDSDLQADFERRFEYDETEDQLRCINEIKRDMERPVPMDRLLCGDVGFGKTEVALRAAFKCIADGKQCALLVPTTILAWQHYQTVLRRMEGLPVSVELLSRFRTPKQQEKIIKELRAGNIDMIIGTHRLVSKDIVFKDLGLLIIDEEQRFGVAQKERLKEIKPTVDVLTLSATPIPRTLNMAMSGLRDMSSIDEAPSDRLPVQTYVLEYDSDVLTDAIRRELRRGGQVYYLHNRVESITACAARIKSKIPECNVGVAHGKMSEDELSEIWRKLIDREIDVLVCTTIIETGVDVPNCNTLIIENADRMGLAQLHQLRGRVGRSSRRAYAYLTFVRGKVLSDIAEKRLEAIREFTEFGSGFKIAMRDLEIRGAGNILGGEQHGHMDAVGYDMYLRMLADAVNEEKGLPADSGVECTVDVQIAAHIPESYISSLPARLGIYRRIADIRSEEDARDVIDELIDRFGDPPKAVNGLIEAALLRNRAASAGIAEIEQKGVNLIIYPAALNMEQAAFLSAVLGRRFKLNAGAKPYFSVRIGDKDKPLDTLREVLDMCDADRQRKGNH